MDYFCFVVLINAVLLLAIDIRHHGPTNLNRNSSALLVEAGRIIVDLENDGKKCGQPGDPNRIFDFRNEEALEKNCKQRCDEDVQCVAFSGIWNSWCIGCKEELNAGHPNAIAFKRVGVSYFGPFQGGCSNAGGIVVGGIYHGLMTKNLCETRCSEIGVCYAYQYNFQDLNGDYGYCYLYTNPVVYSGEGSSYVLCYVKKSMCWDRKVRGCVNGNNIKKYPEKSLDQCKVLCNENAACLAFEYGVAYGGAGGYKVKDCQLQSSSNSVGCDGGYHNLDLYTKINC